MGDSKQVKVDNWGIFFLQRLQTFFNKTYFCDLTLQFEDNVQLNVHRLVLNACTEYFQILEQSCEAINDCLIMPPDLQADVVVPIVNFMYSGILEYQTSIFDRLYSTARLMNMTVLTKLLDAQKVPISPMSKPLNKRMPISPITWNLQGKKISPKTMDPDLPEPLPGRKLPIWKRKYVPSPAPTNFPPTSMLPSVTETIMSNKYFRHSTDTVPRPTRFEWPDDDASIDTDTFDEISYSSKPIIVPTREKSPRPSTSSFESLKRSTTSLKRPASPVYNDSKRVNIQDVKEYIKEQKLRSDYNDYDDSEAADNDLQSYDYNNDSEEELANKTDHAEDTPSKSILKNESTSSHNKRVRFSFDKKENNNAKIPTKIPINTAASSSPASAMDHTKIITEVLKKYPHLVQKNKNIRLKILAKGATLNSGTKQIRTPVKPIKSVQKISYKVTKPDVINNSKSATNLEKDKAWACDKCNPGHPMQFDSYYLYRQHMTEAHNEKAASLMCNVCGHVSRKQNMLCYHKFVTHNIQPPAMYNFPKCKECSYIAITSALLIKHQYNHTHHKLECSDCNITFSNKKELIHHMESNEHNKPNSYECGYCAEKLFSDVNLFEHIKTKHREQAKADNIILVDEDDGEQPNIITAEEIDAMEQEALVENPPQTEDAIEEATEEAIEEATEDAIKEATEYSIEEATETLPQLSQDKPKEKIKILSDIKVKPINTNRILSANVATEASSSSTATEKSAEKTETVERNQPLEPSSEAESLSNVASGIAASLGLVNTIVVLDENNQFILQDGQTSSSGQNFILPDVASINNLVSQQQVITTDSNAIISQAALNKNTIGSTDELVMVLTDHDYSDATSNSVLSDNSNIVVLYSHPVQGQDGQYITQPANIMINSNMGLVEVSNDFSVNNSVMQDKSCEESIEMIQQEINNHIENDIQPRQNSHAETAPQFENDIQPGENSHTETAPQFENSKLTEETTDTIDAVQECESTQEETVSQTTPLSSSERDYQENMDIEPVLTPESSEILNIAHSESVNITPVEKDPSEVLNVLNNSNNLVEEPMEVDEIEEVHETSESSIISREDIIEDNQPQPDVQKSVEDKPQRVTKEKEKKPLEEEKEKEQSDCEKLEIITEESEEQVTPQMKEEICEVLGEENKSQEEKVEDIDRMEVDSTKCNNDIKESQCEAENNEPIDDSSPVTENTIKYLEEKILNSEEICLPPQELNPEPNETLEQSINTSQDQDKDKDSDVTEEVISQVSNLQDSGIETEASQTTAEISDVQYSETDCATNTLDGVSDIPLDSESEQTARTVDAENIENTDQETTEIKTKENSPEPTTKISEEKVIADADSNSIEEQNNSEDDKKGDSSKISTILDDWEDTDSQQSDPTVAVASSEKRVDNKNSINTLINDWEDEEDT